MPKAKKKVMERFSSFISEWSAGSVAFTLALALVVGWLLAGPILGFTEPWQLFIDNATTCVTFLMVFLIQRSEQKNSQALHIKLNAILDKLGIDEEMLAVEHSEEEKLDAIESENKSRAKSAKKDQTTSS